jgi:hypothetical protein
MLLEDSVAFPFLVNFRLIMAIFQQGNLQDYYIGVMLRDNLFLMGVLLIPSNSIILKEELPA